MYFEILKMSIQCYSLCKQVHNCVGEADLKFVLIKKVHLFFVFQTVYVYFESL